MFHRCFFHSAPWLFFKWLLTANVSMCVCSFLSADTFSFYKNNLLLSFRSRERPSHTTDAGFLFRFFGIGTHGQQAIPPSCLFLMTNNVDVLSFQSYFPLLPLHTFPPPPSTFFVLVAHMGYLHLSLHLGKRKPHTLTALPSNHRQLVCQLSLCSRTEKNFSFTFFFFFLIHTHTHKSKIKFTFYSCSQYWLLTDSKETCRDQTLPLS